VTGFSFSSLSPRLDMVSMGPTCTISPSIVTILTITMMGSEHMRATSKNNQINIERPLDTTIKKDGNQRENTYYEKFKSITESYKKITEGIIKLKNI